MLSAPQGERISVRVVDIFMEQSTGCRNDKLSVSDVNSVVRYCTDRPILLARAKE